MHKYDSLNTTRISKQPLTCRSPQMTLLLMAMQQFDKLSTGNLRQVQPPSTLRTHFLKETMYGLLCIFSLCKRSQYGFALRTHANHTFSKYRTSCLRRRICVRTLQLVFVFDCARLCWCMKSAHAWFFKFLAYGIFN